MKWKTFDKYPNCQFNENNTVLKTDSFEHLPLFIRQATFMNGTINPSNLVNVMIKGTCQIMEKKKISNQYQGIEFRNSKDDTTIIDEKLIKPFMQKSSKYYILGKDCPIIVQNKNYLVMIASVLPDYFIPILESQEVA